MATKITKDNFTEEVLNTTGVVILDFWAPWCGPCKMIGSELEKLNLENPEIKICKVNVDDEETFAAEFGVRSIPNVVIYKDGKIINKFVGARSKDVILALCK